MSDEAFANACQQALDQMPGSAIKSIADALLDAMRPIAEAEQLRRQAAYDRAAERLLAEIRAQLL